MVGGVTSTLVFPAAGRPILSPDVTAIPACVCNTGGQHVYLFAIVANE